MNELLLPNRLRESASFFLGEECADAWVRNLPRQIEFYSSEWSLTPEEVLEGGVMSCCVKCRTSEDRLLVLKLPLDEAGGAVECRALLAWAGEGAPGVVKSDSDSGSILMEYVDARPGPPSISEFVDLWSRLPKLTTHLEQFDPLDRNLDLRLEWATSRFNEPSNALGYPLLPRAAEVRNKLIGQTGDFNDILLHGDLQPKNVLRNTSDLLVAIDPLPGVGDEHFDPAFWCVMSDESGSIESNLSIVLSANPKLNAERLHAWAELIAIYELRPYLPAQCERQVIFLRAQGNDV